MRIGIYGGTFNPPHRGACPCGSRRQQRALQLDKLLIVPDNTPPHKVLPAGSPSNAQRLEMVRLAFDGVAGVRGLGDRAAAAKAPATAWTRCARSGSFIPTRSSGC